MANETESIGFLSAISQDQLIVIRFFTIFTSILGTIGNALTILAIVKGRLYTNVSFVFILNLSVTNLIHCVILHPLLAAQAYRGIWTFNKAACVAFAYGLFSNLGTELWGYTWITVNRYFCVVRHHIYKRLYGDTRLVATMLVFSWLFYPFVFLLPLTYAWGHFIYAPRKLICYPFAGYNCSGFCLFVYTIAIVSTVPVIIYCYAAIIRKYVKTRMKVGQGRGKTPSSRTANMDLMVAKTDSERQKTLSELRMAFTILAVIVVFTTCRMPFMVLYLVDPSMSKVNPFVHTLLIYIGSCSNWINPIIYAFSNKKLFNTLRKIFMSWKRTFVLDSNT
ncbi:protein trapped in endoderm-1-like [Mya arenaria]|uniref:protein trapped in endoderm-1-like n=1 Tax=Mya arenaria TaxID=6604 RepID=UPI0022E22156|nr:protein trapped in endoderm-1-like [Mya arenaria]XP_052802536.1 protein trapped in endoderm-1-like [Mya arenaria]XP_052802537.1 protein trapped in endoderm-1-like [Mya arenaria]